MGRSLESFSAVAEIVLMCHDWLTLARHRQPLLDLPTFCRPGSFRVSREIAFQAAML